MANHPSALKRERQSREQRLRNASSKSRIKSAVKKLDQSLGGDTNDSAGTLLIQAISLIDRAGTKGVLHPRTASRKISRLSKKLNPRSAPSA